MKVANLSSDTLRHSSKLAKWLEHGHLIRTGQQTDWKRQYRLRHNWFRGVCKVRELEVAQPSVPPVLVKIHSGIVFTVDIEHGLRAWATRALYKLLAAQTLDIPTTSTPFPSCLGVDTSSDLEETPRITVGLEDGSFHVYTFDVVLSRFCLAYSHPASSNGSVSAIAIALPYVLTMSHNKTLSLYRFPSAQPVLHHGNLRDPELLASLNSNIVYTPLSLSIRTSSAGIVACIAYAFSRLNLGWSVGLQELRLTEEGEAVGSRVASTMDAGMSNFQSIKDQDRSVSARSASSQPFALHPQLMARPRSLSYSHPYLLATLPDNTLMVYLVVSDLDKLTITSGRRLWGHTSSVSGAEVSDRGKAVSVSTKGNEMRVWELEDLLSSSSSTRKASIRIIPEKQDLGVLAEAIARRGNGLGLALYDIQRELSLTRSWVGFDDEQVVVLGELSRRQILSCYDFT